MEPAQGFTDLVVWQRAHQFVLSTYAATRLYPKEERYCLTSQFRRAAISIAANIAESFRKRSVREKIRFLEIAEASLEECRYFLILSNDLGYALNEYQTPQLEETSKILRSYVYQLRRSMS
ncbi:MAG TPA: four helix bundle protein [Bacteroidetes bacterium]|nr:MAG: four helix bundle protein [Ignavibacteria bacterium GWC2_56_12]HAV23104.1 four helix bundle protein [Bacteroidota bacterium]